MISTRLELVTPQKAAEYLQRNNNNRPIRNSHIKSLADMIRDGSWRTTHQGLAFADDGSLIDGQHRLKAIVMANIPAEMMITEGLLAQAYDVLDCGITRSISDRVILDSNETHQGRLRNKKLVSTASMLFTITSMKNNKSSRDVVSAKNTLEMYEKYKTSILAIVDDIYLKIPKSQRPGFSGNKSVLATCTLLHHYSPTEGFNFTKKLFSGEMMEATDPIAITRIYIMKRRHITTGEILGRINWAINMTHTEKTPKASGTTKELWFLDVPIIQDTVV